MTTLIHNPAKPIIPWIGGKRRLAKHILPIFPDHQCYVEPFAGGAALFFLKPPTHVEVLNDINGDLVNLYRVVKHHLEEFVKQFKWLLISRQTYTWLGQTPAETQTDIQRAVAFFYLQKMAFGGKVANQTFGTATTAPPRMNLMRVEEELSMAHVRLARCFIEHLAWDDCVKRYDREHTLFYLDPPYWGTEGYGVGFGLENYEKMAVLAKSVRGRMVISVNDIPEMRQAFDGLNMERTEICYTVGGGAASKTKRGELIIRNW